MSKTSQGLEDFVRELTNHQGDLFFFIRSLCRDPEAAADIRQTVNMILWRKRTAFQLGTNFKVWAFRVAHLEVKNHLRKTAKNKCLEYDPEFLDSLAEELPQIIDEFSDRRHHGQRLLRREAACLHRLSEIYAIHKLHEQEVEAARLAEIVNGHDAPMVQRCERLRLVREPLREFRVRHALRRQQLGRDKAVQRFLPRLVCCRASGFVLL